MCSGTFNYHYYFSQTNKNFSMKRINLCAVCCQKYHCIDMQIIRLIFNYMKCACVCVRACPPNLKTLFLKTVLEPHHVRYRAQFYI